MHLEIDLDSLQGTKVELPSGSVCFVRECLGRHIAEASSMMNGDQKLFLPALMAQCVTFPGKTMVMEDFLDLKAPDYMSLTKIVSDGLGDFT